MLETSNLYIRPITLAFTLILLFSFGILIQNAFADGVQPGSCNNEYDGPITNATIIAENKAYYPLNNSVSFPLPYYKSYYLTFTVKTPSINDQGNSLPGNVWIDQDYQGFTNSGCYGPAYPNQNFTVNETISHATSTAVFWETEVSGFSYAVNWLYPPLAPQNLQASAGNSQVTLSWAAGDNRGSPITNYNIYRSTSSGTETLLSTVGNVTSYADTGLVNGQTYFYKITAVSSVGESAQSNEASATVPSASSGDTVIATIPVGTAPLGVKVNPNTNLIYVANQFSSVSIINGTTNSVVKIIPITGEPIDVSVNPITNKIYVADSRDNTGSVIYGTTNNVVSTINLGTGLDGFTVNPKTNIVYITGAGYSVYVINGTTNALLTTVPKPGHDGFIAVNQNTNMIYATSTGYTNGPKGYLTIIDGTTNTVRQTMALGIVGGGVSVNPTTNMIYVTDSGGHDLFVIDGTTNSIVSTISVGNEPLGVDVNPNTNTIYVANQYDNTVSIINGATNSVSSTISVGSNPHGVSVDEVTNKVYVTNQGSNTVSVINGGPTQNPILATQDIINTINNMALTHGTTSSLVSKLDTVISYLNSNDNPDAKSALQSFVNEVNAQTGKKITSDQAKQLVADAQNVMKSIS